MNKFIQDSLIFQETKKAKKTRAKIQKRPMQNVRKKKLGKITLSSKIDIDEDIIGFYFVYYLVF